MDAITGTIRERDGRMLIELIENKTKGNKTRIKFSKKEYEKLPFKVKAEYSEKYEVHETARTVYFDVDGDLLNNRKEK